MKNKLSRSQELCSSAKTIKSLLYLSAAAFLVNLHACAGTSSSVIATTGTTIGLELSQNQSTQTPTAVLGYKRAELAYVPTNRATKTKTTNTQGKNGNNILTEEGGIPATGSGARDSANVLMELRYRGIFSWGENAGIYQRLAVGDIAVTQPGAALMFSKNDKGELNKDVAKYLSEAQAEVSVEQKQADKIISYVTDGADTINATTLHELVDKAVATDKSNIMTSSVTYAIKGTKTGAELKALLFEFLDTTIAPLYKSLPTDKQ